MNRQSSPIVRRLTAGLLLATSCLTPVAAWAQTGTSGVTGATGTAGTPGAGGSIPVVPGGSGGDGGNGSDGGNGGVGGPGGPGATSAGPAIVNSGTISGGTGGAGGVGGLGGIGGFGGSGADGADGPVAGNAGNGGNGGIGGSSGNGGNGSTGGAGIVASGVTITNSGTIVGGTGGTGGTGGAGVAGSSGGDAGDGGNSSDAGTAGGTGGTGGHGDIGGPGGNGGNGGNGGVGISGANLTIVNSGTISGGGAGAAGVGGAAGADGVPSAGGAGGNGGAGGAQGSDGVGGGGGPGGASGADGVAGSSGAAITFTGGINVLELQAGSTINGAVVAFSAADTLRLGGSSSTIATFDTSQIGGGGQFQNFGVFQKTGTGTWTLTGTPGQATPWTISQGTLAISSDSNLGTAGETLTFNGGTLQLVGAAGNLLRPITLNAGGGTIDTNGFQLGIGQTIGGTGGFTKAGAGMLIFAAPMTYSGGTTVNAGVLQLLSGSGLNAAGALTVNGGTFDLSQLDGPLTVGALSGTGGVIALGTNPTASTLTTNSAANTMLASQITGDGGLIKQGSGILALRGASTFTGGTTVSGGLINFSALNNFGTGLVTLNGGGLQWAAGTTTDISSRLVLGGTNATFDTGGNNVTFASALGGIGGITKAGTGILTLGATNSYLGGTTVTGGLINFTSAGNFGAGNILLNGGGLQWASGSTADISSKLAPLGAGGGTFDTNGNNVTFATGLTGSGGLAKQGLGTLNLTGNNIYSGGTAVLAGTLAVNGGVAGNVAVGPAGTLGGNGIIGGNVVMSGTLAPGNSIGTLTINGNYTQAAGSTYQVEANAAGQADRINVGGAAAIQGGTVQVLAQPGNYANSTTYTILRATGGVSGVYSGVTSNFAFLTPTLSYDANDVFLTLSLGQTAFTPSFLALTPNQRAVGVSLNQSFATASGDFAAVLGVIAGLNTVQGPLALNTISGEPYADFGTMNTNSSMMFMNALGQQMANARGAASAGQRQALAQACEIAACDGVGPLSAWFSALGGLGSVLGDTNASTLTYNFGGAAAGIDYRLDPRFLVGLGVGYTHGTQWVNSFMGQGWSDSVSVAAYGSFTQGGLYVDALAGYAYFNNQLQRQILIPGLQQRTATGSTGANQFLGQIEGGYKVGVYAPAVATITPFGRFQISSVTQNAFSESGAQSLSLTVAQQTTNSQRTTIGADLGSSIGLGNERKLDLAVRLGWMHEFADVARPITAAFAGAPGNSFTVFGATPLRNAAVVGLQATTTIAAATQIYLRYDGEIATGTDNHALNIGLRMSW